MVYSRASVTNVNLWQGRGKDSQDLHAASCLIAQFCLTACSRRLLAVKWRLSRGLLHRDVYTDTFCHSLWTSSACQTIWRVSTASGGPLQCCGGLRCRSQARTIQTFVTPPGGVIDDKRKTRFKWRSVRSAGVQEVRNHS